MEGEGDPNVTARERRTLGRRMAVSGVVLPVTRSQISPDT